MELAARIVAPASRAVANEAIRYYLRVRRGPYNTSAPPLSTVHYVPRQPTSFPKSRPDCEQPRPAASRHLRRKLVQLPPYGSHLPYGKHRKQVTCPARAPAPLKSALGIGWSIALGMPAGTHLSRLLLWLLLRHATSAIIFVHVVIQEGVCTAGGPESVHQQGAILQGGAQLLQLLLVQVWVSSKPRRGLLLGGKTTGCCCCCLSS